MARAAADDLDNELSSGEMAVRVYGVQELSHAVTRLWCLRELA